MDAKMIETFEKIQKTISEFEDTPIHVKVGNSEITKDAKSTLLTVKFDMREFPQIVKKVYGTIDLFDK